jgi:hypothetical protein
MKRAFPAILALCCLILPILTLAQETGNGVIPSQGPLAERIQSGDVGLSDIPLVIVHLIDLVTKIAGTIAVGFLVYGGFQYVASGLTEQKEQAKNSIKYAIIGIIVTFLAWKIVDIVQTNLTS